MVESEEQLSAGWAKSEIVLPARYPMAGYRARKGKSRGTLDPLFVRALILQQGKVCVCIIVADLLLISPASAARLRKRIAKAIGTPERNVIVAATHTHSGPLVDTRPFRLSRGNSNARVHQFIGELDKIFVHAAVAAREKIQPVRASISRAPIHGLAADRNDPVKNRVQPFILVRLEARVGSAVFGVLPCHPTVLGAANLRFSGDLHGEITRRYERQFDVVLIANGACANVSTRFTRRSQTRSQISRFASLVMSQAKSRKFRECATIEMSIASRDVQLPVKNFSQYECSNEYSEVAGRLADVAREGRQVAKHLSKTSEFRRNNITITVTLLRLGSISFAALPFELYAETARFLWAHARTTALCYANGYWGYVHILEASRAEYEVISSPFAACADTLVRKTVFALATKA